MKVKVAFAYAGKEYQPGDDFDVSVLDVEDRNDIFLNRIGGVSLVSGRDQNLPDKPAGNKPAGKGSKKK